MKNYYIFLVILVFSTEVQAQNACAEADSDMNYAYSHAKSSYEANNISDMKYFAHRSREAFKRAQPILKSCGCETVYSLSEHSIDALDKVDIAQSFEDGRFYIKRAKEAAKQAISEFDNCNQITIEEEELLTLEMEQSELKEKQLELELKQETLRIKMLEQKQKEIRIQKEILISNYETAKSSNIKIYDDALRICECSARITKEFDNLEKPFSKSSIDIKKHYFEIIAKLSRDYIRKLENCILMDGSRTVQN